MQLKYSLGLKHPGPSGSRFTRCLHYLAASLVRRSAWSPPLPATLENVSIRWTLALSVRWPMRLHRSPAGNVASTKFPSPRPRTVPSFLVPSFLAASRSLARSLSFAVAFIASLSDPPFALGPRSPRSSFRPSYLSPSRSLPPTSTSNCVSPDTPELLVLAPFP